MNIITRDSLRDAVEARFASGKKVTVPQFETAQIVNTVFGSARNAMNPSMFKMLDYGVKNISKQGNIVLSGNYASGFDVPLADGKSFNDILAAGRFSSNTLDPNWQQFWDAMRIDLTMKKTMKTTLRQEIYDIVPMPNADRIITLQEMYPYAFEFKEINGEGQPVPLGEKRMGQKETMTFYIKATGFVYSLLGQLFDKSLDMTKMNDGVATSYALERDDDAIAPIYAYDYGVAGTAKHTGPFVDAAMKRQELLYNTLADAIDDIGVRPDPFTKQAIPATGLILLCSQYDANHIMQVMRGLPSTNERVYGDIPQISKILVHDTEYIDFENKTLTFAGATPGTAYLIKPNRYMKIGVKSDLKMEADQKPDVLTLAREERAWYYSEAIYNEIGIANFIQKITLPTW